MTLVPINLPPGMYKNGTEYQAQGRWADGNLVRWHNGALQPIGGWEARRDVATDLPMAPLFNDPSLEAVREGVSWSLNDGLPATVLGSNLAVYYMDDSNSVSNITPAGYTPSPKDPTSQGGFGEGFYGEETYGTPRDGAGVDVAPVEHWVFSAWGEDMLMCKDMASPLYSYSDGDAAALVVPNAPTEINGVAVTDERMVMTIGSLAEPRIVQWSDRENREEWTPAITNTAGSYVLKGVGKLLSIHNVLGEQLILSETDAHVGRYQNPPYVYGFDLVGRGCRPISSAAVAVTDKFAIWFGNQTVWMYNGSLTAVPCSVMDFLTKDIDFENVSKVTAHTINSFSECWWLYQSNDSETGEVDSYVCYDHLEQHWATGRLDRTCLVDKASRSSVLMIAADGTVYNHEQRDVMAEGAYAETGPLEIPYGDVNVAVRYLFPDTAREGDAEFYIMARDMPTSPERAFGPYPYNNPISTTGVLGREVRVRTELLAPDSRVGIARIDVSPTGTGLR